MHSQLKVENVLRVIKLHFRIVNKVLMEQYVVSVSVDIIYLDLPPVPLVVRKDITSTLMMEFV
jgi:hypothetical protein